MILSRQRGTATRRIGRDAVGALRRLRSTLALLLLLACLGAALAMVAGLGIYLLNEVLRHAAVSSSALGR